MEGIAIKDRPLGYVQGMNYLASIFLFFLTEEETFWMMMTLIDTYKQRQIYIDLNNLLKEFFVLESLVAVHLKGVHRVFQKYSIDYRMFAVPWFITLFASVLPFPLTIRIFDLYLYKQKFLFQAALAVLKIKESRILKCKTEDELFMVLLKYQEFESVSADAFIQTCLSFQV